MPASDAHIPHLVGGPPAPLAPPAPLVPRVHHAPPYVTLNNQSPFIPVKGLLPATEVLPFVGVFPTYPRFISIFYD